MTFTISFASVCLWMSGFFLISGTTYALITIGRWFYDRKQDKKQYEADRSKAWKQYITDLEEQNKLLRQDLATNNLHKLALLDDNKKLTGRCQKLASELKVDFDKRATQVIKMQASRLGLNPTMEVTEEELMRELDRAAE